MKKINILTALVALVFVAFCANELSAQEKKKAKPSLTFEKDGKTIDISKVSSMTDAEREAFFVKHGVKEDLNPNSGGTRVLMKQKGTTYNVKNGKFEKTGDNSTVAYRSAQPTDRAKLDKMSEAELRRYLQKRGVLQDAKASKPQTVQLNMDAQRKSTNDGNSQNVIEIRFDDNDDQIIIDDTKIIKKRIRVTKNGGRDVVVTQTNNEAQRNYEFEGFENMPIGYKQEFKSRDGVIVVERQADGVLKVRYVKK